MLALTDKQRRVALTIDKGIARIIAKTGANDKESERVEEAIISAMPQYMEDFKFLLDTLNEE